MGVEKAGEAPLMSPHALPGVPTVSVEKGGEAP